ncbi:MAG: hypothetical protein JW914_02815 [Syntrophaceae bacterium]|nr:hypothetical protein [Syntrophaceae bacterium]
MMEFIVALIIGLVIVFYFIEKYACEGKMPLYYAWLAYSFRPILIFCGIGFFFIFIGTDWQSPFWERIIGLVHVLIGLAFGFRYLSKRKEIEDKFKSGEIEPGGEG